MWSAIANTPWMVAVAAVFFVGAVATVYALIHHTRNDAAHEIADALKRGDMDSAIIMPALISRMPGSAVPPKNAGSTTTRADAHTSFVRLINFNGRSNGDRREPWALVSENRQVGEITRDPRIPSYVHELFLRIALSEPGEAAHRAQYFRRHKRQLGVYVQCFGNGEIKVAAARRGSG